MLQGSKQALVEAEGFCLLVNFICPVNLTQMAFNQLAVTLLA